jgi:flavin reductase (DIM6/NTAB) family NADH-FMN oxidoreductase RutF
MMTTNPAPIDHLLLRKSLGCFPTGVVVVTTLGDDAAPVGMTINSFSSVSLDPPLVLWSIALNAPSRDAFRTHSGFTLNILSQNQQSIGRQFATPAEDKFKGISWRPGYEGTPVIADSLAVIQCKPYKCYEGGDHEIILGEVVEFASSDEKPLVFHCGQFVELAEE